MCGIAGVLVRDGAAAPGAGIARAMCGTLVHRGPDDEGVYTDGPLAMGMRRLSIIDLASGHQPIANEDGSVVTVFNGEIYNFPELRAALEARGHRFRTASDTEVIVHLYEDEGEDFVPRLCGMFALAVWDRRRRRLLLARDRLGIKPLYWAEGPGGLAFGSEPKALLAAGVPRTVDLQALHEYLSFNYVPEPRTIYDAIRALPAGHVLVASARGTTVRRYWSLAWPARPDRERSEESWCEELEALLRKVVRRHLLADVPLGVFLSGGVDSSTLVAMMRAVSSQPIRTFSIGFSERSYDELRRARAVARAFETEHHELVVTPSAAELVPRLVRAFDQPFADSSAIPVFCVSRLARQRVKVALSGEGGDEVFAGYETYGAWRVASWYRRLPSLVATRLIPAAVRRLPVSHRRVSFDYKAKRFVSGALLPPADGHYWWKVVFSEDAKASLRAGRGVGAQDPVALYRAAWAACGAAEPLSRLQAIDLAVYLPSDILVKADRMSMANSLEVRVPFLDHEVVEFAASLPSELRMRGLAKKYVLKRTMACRLPPAVLRGRKLGFNVPIPVWLRGELKELTRDVLSPRRVREAGFFDSAAVTSLLDEHDRRQTDHSRPIWGLLMFALWSDAYLRSGPDRGREWAGIHAAAPAA